jgi:RecJ-like exonuclease
MGTAERVKECPLCKGRGVTRETEPELERVELDNGKKAWRTAQQGSGCPKCLGTGRAS